MAQFDMLGVENWSFLPSLLELLMSCNLKLVKVQCDVPPHQLEDVLHNMILQLGKRTLMFNSAFGVDMYLNEHWFQDIMLLSNSVAVQRYLHPRNKHKQHLDIHGWIRRLFLAFGLFQRRTVHFKGVYLPIFTDFLAHLNIDICSVAECESMKWPPTCPLTPLNGGLKSVCHFSLSLATTWTLQVVWVISWVTARIKAN